MMKYIRFHAPWLLTLGAFNLLIILEPLIFSAKAAMLDSNAHILTMTQFFKGLQDGEFPVMWADGFANYGLPLGTISHQLTNYLGSAITFLTHNPLTTYYLLFLIALLLSSWGFYILSSMFFVPRIAIISSLLYSFATYRITNIYIRGALPEVFATIFLPFIAIILIKIYRRQKLSDFVILSLLLTLLVLSHPMAIIIYSIPIVIFVVILFKFSPSIWLKLSVSVFVAVLLAAYYLIPLKLESKYLYYGFNENTYVHDQALNLSSFLEPIIEYSCKDQNYIFWRCAKIKFGLLETILSIIFILTVSLNWITKKSKLLNFSSFERDTSDNFLPPIPKKLLLAITFLGVLITLLLSSVIVEFAYVKFPLLGSIQIPSRFLSPFYFFFALLIGVILDSMTIKFVKSVFWYLILLLIILIQFPQIYGKNYVAIPIERFYFSQENYHTLMIQPKWTIDSREYPVRREKAEIVNGKGIITSRELKNASRKYQIEAESEVLISDNTFYFPGWTVYVDGQKTNIEFQDPAYRGVITFKVPPGNHSVYVVYEDTKVRKIGKLISAVTLSLVIVGLILLRIVPYFKRRVS